MARTGWSRRWLAGALIALAACGPGQRRPASPPRDALRLPDTTLSRAQRETAPSAIPAPPLGVPRAPSAAPDSTYPELELRLNIPAYRLDVLEAGLLLREISVAVGMPRYPTPRGNFSITSVEWNPWWIPPNSEWARKEKPTPPGPDNPMGRVKLYFRPLHYLHGTPFTQTLGSAASHACVRMSNEDAIWLASRVLRAGAPALDWDTVAAMAADTLSTRSVVLRYPVSLEISYRLAEVRDTLLLTHRDIYGLHGGVDRAAVVSALVEAGVDTGAVDPTAENRLVRAARRRPQRMPLDSLMFKDSLTGGAAIPH